MLFRVRHITRYKYSGRVSHCYNLANLTPRNTERQQCISSAITVAPVAATARSRIDYFGNEAYHFEIQKPHKELVITAESELEIKDVPPGLEFSDQQTCEQARASLWSSSDADALEAREFLLNSPMIESGAELAAYAQPSFAPDRPLREAVADLTRRIFEDFTYDPNFTTIATPLADVLKHKRGVCQDFAHLQIGCLRSLGIPAKYVSGYIETLPAPGKVKLVGADATHAWLAYYSTEEGWTEFDPTNNTIANYQHIVTAMGRDYYDVTPVKGVIFGGGPAPILEVSVDVARLTK